MPRALILGGTGAIGRAVASFLLQKGWQVDLTGRHATHLPADLAAAGATFAPIDRTDRDEGRLLLAVLGEGADLVVDATCLTAADATRLLPLAREASCTVMVSSKAVYVDAAGRHANSPLAPHFPVPIREDQPTVAPAGDGHVAYDTGEGYGAHKVAAEQVLLDSGLPITVLRPSKVHGAGARRPREWVFVKRALDARPVLLLAGRGAGVDHPSAAVNIAALVATVAEAPGRRILNAADPDAPSVLQISRTVAALANHAWAELLLDCDEPAGGPRPSEEHQVGSSPWDRPHPIVLDTTAATDLGYRPVGTYATTVADEVQWLITAAGGSPDADLLPGPDDPFFAPLMDYAAEDRFLASNPHLLSRPD